ncbi:hypothetical protein CVD28_25620 [Bacillus sp. M6-12]|nr:hypothetical protein CVD28_25620 [Bacillus sp. M6-12]
MQPLICRTIQDLVNKYTKAYNVQDEFSSGKALSSHKLRHSFAGDWIRNGGNIIALRDQKRHKNTPIFLQKKDERLWKNWNGVG